MVNNYRVELTIDIDSALLDDVKRLSDSLGVGLDALIEHMIVRWIITYGSMARMLADKEGEDG